MAPNRTWRAWVIDSTGKRTERSGEGDMPADVREAINNGTGGEDGADNGAGAAGSAATGATQAVASPAVAPAPAAVPSATAAVVPATATPAAPVATTPTGGAAPAPAAATAPAPAPAQAPAPPHSATAELTSNSFDNAASRNPLAHALSADAMTAPVIGAPATVGNPAMIALGVGLIAGLAVLAVAVVVIYRRRLHQRDAAAAAVAASRATANNAADMFLDFGDKNPIPKPMTPQMSIKGKRIGEPMLVNTTAMEALRGPGVISAGPPAKARTSTKPRPKLSLANYRTNGAGVGGPTIVSPAPSPRSRGAPSGVFGSEYAYSISLASPASGGPYTNIAPSPNRISAFDCAPSPLPTDGRQRHARYDYSDALPSPARVVGHRRAASRSSTSMRQAPAPAIARQAFYGQGGLNRLSAASGVSSTSENFLSIPVASRYSFDRDQIKDARDVHGMI